MKIYLFLLKIRHLSSRSHEGFVGLLLRSFFMWMRGKRIFLHRACTIRGLERIKILNSLEIGVNYVGFSHPYDVTLLNVRGELEFRQSYSISRGCRFDIGPQARATFGSGYVNPHTKFVIMNGLSVGDGTVISWDCLIMDEDFHEIQSDYRVDKDLKGAEGFRLNRTGAPIEIGDNVWIGANVTILKGAVIPPGSVVAAGAVVTSVFDEPNVLLAGTPAKVVRRNVYWGKNIESDV